MKSALERVLPDPPPLSEQLVHRHTVVRTLRRIVPFLAAVASLPATAAAQTKWYTITGIAGVQYQYHDDYLRAAVWNINFTVVNTQTVATLLMARPLCGPFSEYSEDYDETVCPPPVDLSQWTSTGQRVAPGATAIVSVPIYVDGTRASGTISLDVTGSYSGSRNDLNSPIENRSAVITIVNGTPTASLVPPPLPPLASFTPLVTPKSGFSILPANAWFTRTFAVQNVGSLTAIYALRPACETAGCWASKSSMTLAPGSTDSVVVSFLTPDALATNTPVSMTATYTNEIGQTISDIGAVRIATPVTVPVVSPKGASPTVVGPGEQSLTFLVTKSGTSYQRNLIPICDSWLTGCTVGATWPANPDNAGDSIYVQVRFTGASGPGGPGAAGATVRLAAQLVSGAQVIAADTGFVPAVGAYAHPTLSPNTSSFSASAGSSRSQWLTLTNTGNATATYTLACVGSSGCQISPSFTYVTLAAGASTSVAYSIVAPAIGQTSNVRISATASANTAFAETDTASISITGVDLYPPSVISGGLPPDGTVSTAAVMWISLLACDPDGQLATPTLSMNGSPVNAIFTPVAFGGCASARSAEFPVTLQSWANDLALTLSDGVHTVTTTRKVYYDYTHDLAPRIATPKSRELLRGGQAWADTFFVTNPGPIAGTYGIAAPCISAGNDCVLSQSSLLIAPGQTAKVWISYVTPRTTTTVAEWVVVSSPSPTGPPAVFYSDPTIIDIDATPPSATITSPADNETVWTFPTLGVQWCDGSGTIASHAIRLDGVLLADSFAPDSLVGCASSATSTVPSTPVTLGTHSLVATVTDVAGNTTTVSRSFTFALPAVDAFRPAVTVVKPSAYLIPDEQTITFVVRNAGTSAAVYDLTSSCGGIASVGSCMIDRPKITLDPNRADTVRLTFALTALPSAPVPVSLVATYRDLVGRTIADSAAVNGLVPSLAELYRPSIAPGVPYVVPPFDTASALLGFGFAVRNLGLARATYRVDVTVSNGYGFVPGQGPPQTITLAPGQIETVAFTVLVPPGNRTPSDVGVTLSYVSPSGATVSATAHGSITPGIQTYGFSVGPKNQYKVAGQTPELNHVGFTVVATGNAAMAVSGVLSCSGFVIRCTDAGNSSYPARSIGTVPSVIDVQFDVDTLIGRSGTITLAMRGDAPQSQYVDTGTYVVTWSGRYVALAIAPKLQRKTVPANAQFDEFFQVTNVGTEPAAFALSATCSGTLTCSLSSTTPRLDPGQDARVAVHVASGPAGSGGTVKLTASSTEALATADGAIIDSSAALPRVVVATRSVNPGATVARDQCLAISAGSDAAYECGDLRITHALPSTSTMGRSWTPVLVYNSAQANGRGVIAADITVQQGVSVSSLRATLSFGQNKTVTRDIPWNSAWGDGISRRISIPFDANALSLAVGTPVALLPYRLDVTSADDPTATNSDTGVVAIVNRAASPFGRGWWLDGLEQLSNTFLPDSSLLWVGGDGSVRLYVRQSASLWAVVPSMDRPDVLERVGTGYRRHLPNGAYVEFDFAGRHRATVGASGDRTEFVPDPFTGALAGIDLPVPAGSPADHSYHFTYDAERLESVDAPGGRHVGIAHPLAGSTTSIRSITDPGLPPVVFDVDAAGVISRRTNRLGEVTRFGFDAQSHMLVADTIDMLPGEASLVASFCPAEAASLACGTLPIVADSVHTLYDGLRSGPSDSMRVFITRYGAPYRIVDAAGNEQQIERKDSHWPLLPTATVDALGHRVEAVYDPLRGLPLTIVDVNRFALQPGSGSPPSITQYEWDTACDEPTRITSPTWDTRIITYDHPSCLRHTERDGRGDSTTTTFGYDTAGRLKDILYPNSIAGTDHFEYDDVLGNLRSTRTPLGVTTFTYRDAVGRDTLSRTPLDALGSALTHRSVYDTAGRDSISAAVGPRGFMDGSTLQAGFQPSSADSLVTTSVFDAEGRLRSATRHESSRSAGIRDLTTAWQYDPLGRKRVETAPDGQRDLFSYGDGLNLTHATNRNREGTTFSYDVLNRMTARVTEQTVSSGSLGLLVVPAQKDSFEYDQVGRMKRAVNPNADIRREYTIGGLLHAETQSVASADFSFGAHEYVMRYDYDLAGRRTHFVYPSQLAIDAGSGDGSGVVDYTYDPGSGQLHTITLNGNREFAYSYDARGRQTRQSAPNGVVEERVFDEDDRLTKIIQRAPAPNLGWFSLNPGHAAFDTINTYTLSRDVLGHVVRSVTYEGAQTDAAYNALGSVLYMRQYNPVTLRGGAEETYDADPMGNVWRRTIGIDGSADSSAYDPATGRLLSIRPRQWDAGVTMAILYDAAGNQQVVDRTRLVPMEQGGQAYLTTRTQHAYDASGHLRLIRTRRATPNAGGIPTEPDDYLEEETRYDALGRRVWVRDVHQDESIAPCSTFCSVTRFVWDGDELLGEFHMPIPNQENDVQPIFTWQPVADSLGLIHRGDRADSTQSYSWRWGRVAYTHGLGVDQPLAITRGEAGDSTILFDPFTMYPLLDWRGNVVAVSFAGGGPLRSGNAKLTPPLAAEKNADLTAYRWRGGGSWVQGNWSGSLVDGQFGASGLEYRRNRYYDPQQGRFTQEDPIGLAGGMNLYGFAGGDPVNFSDPFGLCGPLTPLCVWFLANLPEITAVGTEIGTGLVLGRGRLTGRALQQAGRAGEIAVEAGLVREGYMILGRQVSARTSAGRRVIDFLAQHPDGTLVAFEAKSGNATRNAAQLLKDELMATDGAVLVGKNAPSALQGSTLVIPTQVRRP